MATAPKMQAPAHQFASALQGHGPTQHQCAAFSLAGISIAQIQGWIATFGPAFLNVLHQVVTFFQSLVSQPTPAPITPTPAELAKGEELGCPAPKMKAFAAAGLPPGTLLAWLSALATKAPQFISTLEAIAALFGITVSPTPPAPPVNPTPAGS